MKSHAAEMVRAYLEEVKRDHEHTFLSLSVGSESTDSLKATNITKDVAQLLKDFDAINADLDSARRVQTSMSNVLKGSAKKTPHSTLKIKGHP